ncbi:hypothetical protein B566_EDAN000793 [Ephemera danica]|nr:hypothetical protein B566_EDAN000793 [Ephemera danica]
MSWDDANAKCAELGMHLLIVDTSTELTNVLSNFAAVTTGDFWVGLKRTNQNPDTYAWVDGTSVSVAFTNNGKECGIYNGSVLTTILCNPTKAYVCEREVPC